MAHDQSIRKLRHFLCISGIVVATGYAEPQPLPGAWVGYAAIADDQLLPIRAYLDLAAETPNGYFISGDERSEIPEIMYTGDSLRLVFTEYGAELAGRLTNDRYAGKNGFGSRVRKFEEATSHRWMINLW